MRRLRLIGLAVVVFIVVAVAADRLALFVWRARIQHYYERLSRSVERAGKVDPLHYYDPSSQPMVIASGSKGNWQVPLLTVSFAGPKPDGLMVDGNGGLVFVYKPPIMAWSRHLPFLGRPSRAIQGSDLYAFNDIYFLSIHTLEGRPGGETLAKPSVRLEHGLPF